MTQVSIIIPAKNELSGLITLVPDILMQLPEAEVIIIDDGSTDGTAEYLKTQNVKLIRHPYSKGNGASIKTGARHATAKILVTMDADGQHQPKDIVRLINKLEKGYDMVVGARDRKSQAGAHRSIANGFYNLFSSWMVGHKIEDLTSGFRAVRADKFKEFIHLLPNGFSYPTTITMSFFRAGYSVTYETIFAPKRIGKSHVKIWRDGVRFFLIIFKIGTLFSPLKLFIPIAIGFFIAGLGYYAFTFIEYRRFTNMSALFLSNSILTFLIGLIAEQITTLTYTRISGSKEEEKQNEIDN